MIRTQTFRSLARDDRGLTTVEDIIVLGLIAVLGISAWEAFGERLETEVNEAERAMKVVDPG